MTVPKLNFKKLRFFLTISLSIVIIIFLGQIAPPLSPLPQIAGISVASKLLPIIGGAEVNALASSPYQDISGNVVISGDVGIGTAESSYKLEVKGDKGLKVTPDNWANVANPGSQPNSHALLTPRGFSFSTDDTTLSSGYQPTLGIGLAMNRSNPALAIRNKGGPGIIIESGNVGIGTTKIEGQLHISTSMAAGVVIDGNGTGTNSWALVVRDKNKANTMYIRDEGYGWLRASAWAYGSDKRMKENIKPLTINALQIVRDLKPVTFDYIKGVKNEAGFIAQDVQPILPNLITQGEDGMLAMKTTELIPYLVKSIQEQQKEIELLKKEIELLKTR